MKLQITILLVFIASLGFAQTSIKKNSIDSGGIISQSGNITMLSTIGEIAVQENTNANVYISEGFIGPDITSVLKIEQFLPMTNVSIFPNPAVDFLNVSFLEPTNAVLILYDNSDKMVLKQSMKHLNHYKINMRNIIVGTYLLLIKSDEKQSYKSFKIIKK